jgi:hypothetical protein
MEQTLLASADLKLGKAAFAEAVRQRPNQRIPLRHKTRVIEEHQKFRWRTAALANSKWLGGRLTSPF